MRSPVEHPVVLTRKGHALHARIDRPGAGNACSSAVMEALEGWLDQAADPQVRVLVLTGTGRTFCGGADLEEGTSLLADPHALHAFLDRGRALVRRLREAPVPTIAAVNGAAFGGGLELVLACDLAVAGRAARLGDGHIGVGQVPGWGSSAMLPLAVGPALARRLLLTGEGWTATEAERRGLVSEVVDDADLDARVSALATTIAGHDPVALQRMLGLARAATAPASAAWDREAATLRTHLDGQHADQRDAVLDALRSGGSTRPSGDHEQYRPEDTRTTE